MNSKHQETMNKDEIRLRVENMRSQLSKPEDSIAGERVLRNILALPDFFDSLPRKTVMGLYYPIHMEVNLLSNIGMLREKGVQIALPRVREGKISFSIVQDEKELVPGAFGITEPPPQAPRVPIQDMDVLCVPGLAFDLCGARIGYGKGFYDQFLRAADERRRPVLIGVGYDFQVMDVIPQEEHDRRMDYIAAPSGATKARFSI